MVATTPRKAKLSDFPDAMHAMYAPYVDVFRADSFMAPHVNRCVQRHSTIVVSKLDELVTSIGEVLKSRKVVPKPTPLV